MKSTEPIEINIPNNLNTTTANKKENAPVFMYSVN